MTRIARLGAVLAVALWFPAAVLVALLYRFPVPLGGYARGLSDLHLVPLAVIFYGLFGGFVLVPTAGALGAWFVARHREKAGKSPQKLVWVISGSVGLAAALFLALLEEVIGPW